MRSICHTRQGVHPYALINTACTAGCSCYFTGCAPEQKKTPVVENRTAHSRCFHCSLCWPFSYPNMQTFLSPGALCAVNKCQKHALSKNKHISPPPVIENSSTIPSGGHVSDQTLFKTQNSPDLPAVCVTFSGQTRPQQHLGVRVPYARLICAGWFHWEQQCLALSLFGDHQGLSRWEINKCLGPNQGMQTPAPLRKSDRGEVYDGQKEIAK